MNIKFSTFEDSLIDSGKKSLLGRGKSFCDKNLIQHVHAHSGNEWDVYVQSEEHDNPGYTVKIKIKQNKVTFMSCNCLGFSHSPICKHVVASLYAIRDKDMYDSDISEGEAKKNENVSKHKKVLSERKNMMNESANKEHQSTRRGSTHGRTETMKSPLTKELECQECHNQFTNPVMLPCQSHSICLSCLEGLLEKVEEDKHGVRELECPTCGEKGGLMSVKDIKDLKLNQEMERIMFAYDKERRSWFQKKEELERRIDELMGNQKSRPDRRTVKDDSSKGQNTPSQYDSYDAFPKKTKQEAEEDFFGVKKEIKEEDSKENPSAKSSVQKKSTSSLGKREADENLEEVEASTENSTGHNLRPTKKVKS